MTAFALRRISIREWTAAALGVAAAALAVAPNPLIAFGVAALLGAGAVAWWTLAEANRWLLVLFGCLLLLPPLPIPMSEGSLHVAPLVAALGLLVGLTRLRAWGGWRGAVAPPLFVSFFVAAAASTALAGIYSGAQVQMGSFARLCLLAISVYVFLFTYSGPGASEWNSVRVARILLAMAGLSALFACVDFYYQLPAPAGYGPQFVWLDTGVFRRAQGLFYEASTLGNLCACFLVMVVVAWLRPRGQSVCPRPLLAVAAIVLSIAMIFSYSRASLVCFAIAMVALGCLRRTKLWRAVIALGLCAVLAVVIARVALPSLLDTYLARLVSSFQHFQVSPDGVLSGRLTTWTTLIGFLQREPWHALLGIGYKTLPYSDFAGEPIIADNTYLSLLVETGVVGLFTFLLLNIALLRLALRAARSPKGEASFFGQWMFCFWSGQMVQMLSGDLITYWRVLPIYFWALATAAREGRNGE
jgi:O-antigen ligase